MRATEVADRTLLIDADVLAYQFSSKVERPIKWDEHLWTLHADESEAINTLDNYIVELQEKLEAPRVILALSDVTNWRHDVLPSYKDNRRDTRKPLCLHAVRQHMRDSYETYERENLEGDDILGILATHRSLVNGEKVIVTIDKDLTTIPGLHYRMHHGDLGVFEVTKEEADHFHLLQAFAGDPTDGYSGCPGVGIGTAQKLLASPRLVVPVEKVISRGPRKGQVDVRWEEGDECSPWECIVSHYKKAGLDEEAALQQARVARILRATDYDFKKKEVILWNPPTRT